MRRRKETGWDGIWGWCLAVTMAAAGICMSSVWLGQRLYEARLLDLLGQTREAAIVRDLAAGCGGRAADFLLPAAVPVLLAVFFRYLYRRSSRLLEDMRSLGLQMEQMVAGKETALARWEDGPLAALSNQAELLYKRNSHMVELVQREKEQLCHFVENMVHQMKTPLTSLWLNLDLMEEKLSSEELPEKFKEAMEKKLEDCSGQCRILKEKTADFLQAGQLSAGQVRMLAAPADLDALTAQAAEELRPVLEKRKILVETGSASRVPLYCDSGWMKAAISNVIKNSAEAMEQGGKIRIRHWDADGWKYLELRDEGGGFSEEEAGRLFERFYTGKGREGGSGLGLHIAREVVEANHGRLTAQPVPEEEDMGEGARFLMKFRILSGAEAYGE